MGLLRVCHARVAGLLLLALSGCTTLVGIEEGTPYDGVLCSTVSDCAATVEAADCREVRGCEGGRCVVLDAIEGTRLSEQTDGDCVDLVCDGKGKAKRIALPADVPDDDSPCTVGTCVGTEPVQELLSWFPCYSGPFGDGGQGDLHRRRSALRCAGQSHRRLRGRGDAQTRKLYLAARRGLRRAGQ